MVGMFLHPEIQVGSNWASKRKSIEARWLEVSLASAALCLAADMCNPLGGEAVE